MSSLKNKMGIKFSAHYKNCYPSRLLLIKLLLLVFLSPLALAQHEMHGMSASTQINTMPANDAVLTAAPASLMLHFESEMRLVKLVLKAPEHGFINIGFRYQPATGLHFMQSLPTLAAANYYTVEWAALNANEELIKGIFHFSFGDNAMLPSYYLDQIKHPDHIMSPDYRLL